MPSPSKRAQLPIYARPISFSSCCPAEDLCAFLVEQGVPTAYLHSGVKPMHRLELLQQLRAGDIDVIVGVNLLREVRTRCVLHVLV